MQTGIMRSAGVVARDLRNRSRGLIYRFRAHEPVSDEAMVARVRSKLGHVCSHPRALEVSARDGVVELKGSILASEELRVLWAVAGIEGVRNVYDELDVHEHADVPQLRGGVVRRSPALHTNAPAIRFLFGVVIVGLVAAGAAFILRRQGTRTTFPIALRSWM